MEAVTAEEVDAGDALVFAVAGHSTDAAVVEDGKAVEAGNVAVPGFAAEWEDGEHGADVGPSFGVWACPS